MSTESTKTTDEHQRAQSLKDAQNKANDLFLEIEKTLIKPGISEKELSNQIHALGTERHGIRTHWHKRVIRSGPNTLFPYADNPPDRTIQEDDILFVDLGPVFEQWEADFGRTFVLGADPAKIKLKNSLEPMWHAVKARFDNDQDITGEKLYAIACGAAKDLGYEFGGEHSGHLVGDFPHERIPNDKVSLFITGRNDQVMRSLGKDGLKRHWILEIHLVDREKQIGGFFEQLLTVD